MTRYEEALDILRRAQDGQFGRLPAELWDTIHDFLHRQGPSEEEAAVLADLMVQGDTEQEAKAKLRAAVEAVRKKM